MAVVEDGRRTSGKSVVFDDCADIDKAIAQTGYGLFHYQIVSVCAILLLANGLQNGLAPYVFAAAQCEMNLTSAQLGALNVAFLVGGVTSTFLWGTVADLTGRRRVLLYSLLIDVAVTVLCALMGSFHGLAICRFINGFLIGAPGSITYNYIAEFHAPKHRAKSICYTSISFTGAWLLLPILAYTILPLPSLSISPHYHLTTWRLLLILLATPELLAGIWLLYLPETPKYHVAKGDTRNALEVLRDMYRKNQEGFRGVNQDGKEYPVKHLEVDKELGGLGEGKRVQCQGKVARIVADILGQIRCLFSGPNLRNSMLMSTALFCNMFGFFGLGLWLPELFKRFHQYHSAHPNSTITVSQLASLQLEPIFNETQTNISCTPTFDNDLLVSTLAVGVSSIVGNILAGFLSVYISRKLLPSIAMMVGSVASGSIYWLQSSTQNLVVSCLYQMAMTVANISLGSVTVELFPTSIGAMAFCCVLFAGRMGAICSNTVFGLLMDSYCEVPIFSVAFVVGIGGVLCLIIPEEENSEEKLGQGCCELTKGYNTNSSKMFRRQMNLEISNIAVIADEFNNKCS